MDVTQILENLDEYARDYITYVLSITSRRAFKRQTAIVEKRLVTFSLISVVLGVYLYQLFSSASAVTQAGTLATAFGEYAVWLFMAVIVYFGLRHYGAAAAAKSAAEIAHGAQPAAHGPAEHGDAVARRRNHAHDDVAPFFQTALWIVLRVLPVAYLVASYLAVLAAEAGKFLMRDGCSPWAGLPVFVVAESVAIVAFLPVAIQGYVADARAARIWAVTLFITALLLGAQALSLITYLRETATALYDKPENAQALAQAESFISNDVFAGINGACAVTAGPPSSGAAGAVDAGGAASSSVGVQNVDAVCARTRTIEALERLNWEGIEACFVR